MPLEPGDSQKVISENIGEMRHAGHSEKQSVAAAEHNADKYRRKSKGRQFKRREGRRK